MGPAKTLILIAFLGLVGCCLTTPEEKSSGTGRFTTSGSTSGGAFDSGSGSTGGADSGVFDVGCDGVYCAPGYQCDPVDGVCRCGGEDCSGDCEADSGTCLVTCPADAGGGPYPILGTSAYAVILPPAVVGSPYIYQLQADCGDGPVAWFGSLPPSASLNLVPSSGILEGLPQEIPDGGPLILRISAYDDRGDVGSQNYLLSIGPPDSGE